VGQVERVESQEARAIVKETPAAALRENGPVAPRKREHKASVRAHPLPIWPKAILAGLPPARELPSWHRREVAVKGELVRYGPSAWVARAGRTWFAWPALSRSTAIALGRCTVGYRTLPVYPRAATSRRGRGDDFYGCRLGRPFGHSTREGVDASIHAPLRRIRRGWRGSGTKRPECIPRPSRPKQPRTTNGHCPIRLRSSCRNEWPHSTAFGRKSDRNIGHLGGGSRNRS